MTTIQFKKSSGAAANSFSAVRIEPDFYVPDPTLYDDINRVLRMTIDASYKQWNIRLGLLTEAQMDYLLELKKEDAPQFIHATVTYDVRLLDIKPRRWGGRITVINTAKET